MSVTVEPRRRAAAGTVADTYADLTQNPRNPYRKILRPFEACEVLGL